jgi:methyl-accepting chemotaxis protein
MTNRLNKNIFSRGGYTGTVENDRETPVPPQNGFVLNEILKLMEAAKSGDLHARANTEGSGGDDKLILESVNIILDEIVNPLNTACDYVNKIGNGEIPDLIEKEYKGEFNQIRNNLNKCITAITHLTKETDNVADAVVKGRLDYRADSSVFSGKYKKLVDGINAVIDTLAGHIEAIPAPIMIIDRDFNINFMNTAGAEVVNTSQSELIGKKCYDYFKTSDCRTSNCALANAMRNDMTVNRDTDAHPDGKDLWISYTGAPVKDRDNNIVGAIEIVVDQTATQKAIKDAETKVDFLNKIPTPVMVIDKEFNVQFMNPAGANAVARTPDACRGQKCFNLFNTGHCNTSDCQVAKAMWQDGIFTNDTTAKLPSGELPIRYTGAPLKNDDGEVVGGLEYVLDISKEMEITKGVNELVNAALNGKLETRADIEKFQGNYRTIIKGVNDTLDAVIKPLKVAAEYVERISRGDVPEQITDEYKGDFNEIKNNLNNLIDSMNEITNVAEEIAGGNLMVSVEKRSGQDRLMEALSDMVRELSEVASAISTAAEQVASGSQQVASSAQQTSQGASEQAANAEEVSSSIEQMTANISQNADNATQTDSIATKAAKDAQESGRAVSEAVEAMKQIADKIGIIEEIARNTNMLALNAAIEAARAGEQGKGFAVVAAEVRKLAERSQQAAGEITKLSLSSTDVAEKAGEMLNKLVPDIQKTSELIQEISAASREQKSGADQISKAIQQLDIVIQQNSSSSEEMSSTSEELSSQAEQLSDTISFFKIEENGKLHEGSHGKTRRQIKVSNKRDRQVSRVEPVKTKISTAGQDKQDNLDDDFEEY